MTMGGFFCGDKFAERHGLPTSNFPDERPDCRQEPCPVCGDYFFSEMTPSGQTHIYCGVCSLSLIGRTGSSFRVHGCLIVV